MLVPERWRPAGNTVTIGLLVAIGVVLKLPLHASVAGFYTSSIMIELLLGILLGVLVVRDGALLRIPVPIAWAVMIGAIAFAVVLPAISIYFPRMITRGIPAFFAVGAMLALERQGQIADRKALRLLGDASYSLYLSHFVVLSVVSQIWRRLPIAPSPLFYIAFGIVAVGISLIAGVVCYRFVEQPLTVLFQQSRQRRTQLAEVA